MPVTYCWRVTLTLSFSPSIWDLSTSIAKIVFSWLFIRLRLRMLLWVGETIFWISWKSMSAR